MVASFLFVVYPRVCGGAESVALAMAARMGLSPRVRGSHRLSLWIELWSRSIPACAGEPPFGAAAVALVEVYPRVCGGAIFANAKAKLRKGLSPRVRGSRSRAFDVPIDRRSIPACAGEPALSARQ